MSDVMQPAPKNPMAKASVILGIAGFGAFVLGFILVAVGLSSLNGSLMMIGGLVMWLTPLLGLIGLILGIVSSNQGGSKVGLILNAVLLGLFLILLLIR